MTKTVVLLNANDTVPSGGSATMSVEVDNLNWSTDWAKTTNVAGNSVLTLVSAPPDQPQTARVGLTQVANVYTGTSVDPSYQLPFKRGVSAVAQLNAVYRVTDSDPSILPIDLPVSAHIVLRVPLSSLLTNDHMLAVIARTIPLLFDTSDTSSARIGKVLRGALLPEGI